MKITLRPATINATEFVLGDNAVRVAQGFTFPNGAGGAIRDGWRVKQTRSLQQTPLVRSEFVFLAPRYNLVKQFSFTVDRTFESRVAIHNFLRSHDDLVPAIGTLILYDPVAGENSYLPGAVPVEIDCLSHNGVSCAFQYTFKANASWQNHP